MTNNQKERFLKIFQDYQDLVEVLCGLGGSAIVFRFGVIFLNFNDIDILSEKLRF
jgi:hypothetical protein